MSEKCKAEFKNLNHIQSFSEQRYATVQWAEQVCKNDEWLRQQVTQLNYLTPAAIRKRFSPILVDESLSYGYKINSESDEQFICFDGARSVKVDVDFTDMGMIDESKTDAVFESYVDDDGNIKQLATIPRVNLTDTKYFGDFNPGESINSFWYVGFDKNKQYQLRPDWINDCFDSEIPSIVRAQTFTVTESGFLESVDLYIANNGVTNSNWASPLFVQVFRTEPRVVEKTAWDLKKKMSIPTGVNETIYWPVGTPLDCLATAMFQPNAITPGFHNFMFDKPINVTEGEHYAIVISSPLSHWDHCPRIGGWGRNCATDKYSGGDAFLSDNNGRSFERYGRNDEGLSWNEYRYGKLTPMDFAFKCHVKQYTEAYDTEGEYYLYLKPIRCNPITSVFLTKDDSGDSASNKDVSVVYEASADGRNWTRFVSGQVVFNPDENDEYPTTLFIRAILKSENQNLNPSIDWLSLIINTKLPREMYIRTPFYNPKTVGMLSANIWGRVYAPFEYNPANSDKVECAVEIIQDRLVKEDFKIITVGELDYYLNLTDENGELILNTDKITGKSNDERAKYLIENHTVVENLKSKNVYIKPYTYNNQKYFPFF